MNDQTIALIISFCSGALTFYTVVKTLVIVLRVHDDFNLIANDFRRICKRVELDQAFVFVIKKEAYHSFCWAKSDPVYWEKIRAFEKSIFDGMKNGTVSVPYVGDFKRITTDQVKTNDESD